MAIGDRSSNELLNVVAVSGAQDPGWFAAPIDNRAQIPFVFSLIAGTATYILEGRNTPNDTPVQLDTASASKKILVEKFMQFRCRLSAATGATCVGSIPSQLVKAS